MQPSGGERSTPAEGDVAATQPGPDGRARQTDPERPLNRRERQLAAIARLGLVAIKEADLGTVFREATRQVTETLDVEFCKVLELLPGGERFILRAGHGWDERLVGQLTVEATPALQAGYTLHSSEPVIVDDVATERRFDPKVLLGSELICSGISIVIHGRDEPYGILAAHSVRRLAFSEDDILFVQSMANLLGEAVVRRRAEEEAERLNRDLERRVAELEALHDVLPVGIAIAHDPEATHITTNPALADLMGLPAGVNVSPGAASGTAPPYRILRRGREIPVSELPMQVAAWHNRPVREVEFDVVRNDGQRFSLLAYAVPLHDEHGQARGSVGAFVDITDLKRTERALRESEEFARRMLESSQDCIKVLDLEGRILSMNASGQQLMRIADFATIRGISWFDFWEGQAREAARQATEAALAGGTGRFVGLCPTGKGEPKWWDVAISPMLNPEGAPDRLLAVSRDVTEQQRSTRTTRFLTEATMMLASSLEYEQTFANIAGLMVPAFADWCAIDVLADDGTVRPVTIVHSDPERVELAHEMRRRYPPRPEEARWMQTNEPELYTEIDDDLLVQSARDEEHLRFLRAMGLRSAMVVPLTVRNRTLGAVTLVHAEGERRYTASDLPAVVELARACAMAIDNARLYREAQHEIEERRRAEAEVARLNRDLERRLEELQTLLDVSPVGLAVALDPECRQINANPAFAAMLGITSDTNASKSAMGDRLPFKVLRDGREMPPDELPMQYAARHDLEVREVEFEIHRADGSVLSLLEYASPLHDEQGNVRGVLGAFVDVTALKQAEKAIRRSELRLRQLADAMPQIVWIADADGFATFINQQWRDYTGAGLEATNMTGLLETIIHPDDLPTLVKLWRRASRTGTLFEAEYRMRRADDGVYRWFLARSVPIHDEHGAIVEWFGTATDIDAQKAAETALREESHTLETINRINATIAAELDLEPLVQAVIDAGTELSGAAFGAFFYTMTGDDEESFTLYALSGASMEAFREMPVPRNTELFGPTYSGTGVVRHDDVTQHPHYGRTPPFYGMPDGHLPVRSYLAAPVAARSGEVLGALFFGHPEAGVFTERAERIVAGIADQAAIAIENARLYRAARKELAERIRAEHQLKELNETLEQRVRERTTALADTNDRLKAEINDRMRAEIALERTNTALLQSNRELQEFAYVASHDLQEPLRKISSFADLLRSDYDDRLDDNGRLFLSRMQEAALRMSGLITDLLSFSRVATRGQPFALHDLNAIVDGVLSDLEVRIQEVHGHVDVGRMPALEVDPTQMRQLFQNLLSNALKFHREGMPPVVRVRATTETGSPTPGTPEQTICRITVEDNGIGFDEKYLDRIFSPFQRLHGRSAYPGSGIGLAICRRIVERHHGSITAHSTPGQGSTFIVLLPVRQYTDGGSALGTSS